MPLATRARLVRHYRSLRKARKRQIAADHARAAHAFTVQGAAPDASTPSAGLGTGHVIYTIGPITFCKLCGATKSLSEGSRLAKPCRRWAPKGTRAVIMARLRGKTFGFYRSISQGHSNSVRAITTTLPQPACCSHSPPVTAAPRRTTFLDTPTVPTSRQVAAPWSDQQGHKESATKPALLQYGGSGDSKLTTAEAQSSTTATSHTDAIRDTATAHFVPTSDIARRKPWRRPNR